MPHHLQADSVTGPRARVQTHPVLRSGILPSDELRSRLLEMSRLQVSRRLSYFASSCGLMYTRIIYSFPLIVISKTALLEGLEIDQYLWGILNTLSSNSSSASDAEEVTIDSAANWRPVNQKLMGASVKTEDDGGQETSCHGSKRAKVMSPGSVTLPTMPNWDLGQSLSPFCPPDMNSKIPKAFTCLIF